MIENLKALGTFDEKMFHQFCSARGIKKVLVFGSVLSGQFNAKSDIDLIVEFEDGMTPGLIAFSGIMVDFSEKFFGKRKVDLLTRKMLRGELGELILRSAEVIYEKAA